MSLNTFRPVALIPAYNHYQVIDELLDALEALDLPVILVDDGSNDLCARSLDVSAASHRKASLVRLAKNGGKGAAVIAGLYVADNMNFTHAIQIDATGSTISLPSPTFWIKLATTRRHLSAAIPFTIRRSP